MMESVDLNDDQTPLDPAGNEEPPKKNWNLFRILPPDEDDDLVEDQKFYLFLLKTLKVLAYLITFIVVIGAAVIAKSTAILMTSQLEPTRTVSYCYKLLQDRQFITHSNVEERISWYWAIYFAFLVPEVQVVLRAVRKIVFKGQPFPSKREFFIPFLFETLHTIGLAILVYHVMPKMDAIKAVMITNAVCLIPAIFGLISRGYDKYWVVKCIMDVIAIIFQLSALFVWPLFSLQKSGDRPWMIPIALLLISCGWWENYLEPESPFEFVRNLANMKKRFRTTRYWSYTFISLWKMFVFLVIMVLSVWWIEPKANFTLAFDTFQSSFKAHNITVEERRPEINAEEVPDTGKNYLTSGLREELSNPDSLLFVMLAQGLGAYLCYIFAKFTCKICIQAFSFAFPILLAVPITIVTLITLCGMRETEVCFWDNVMPGYLFWTCPKGDIWEDFFAAEHAWVWLLWIISQIWVTIHIWSPKGLRLAATETMFATPMYNNFLIDQSIAMNRRRDEELVEIDGEDVPAAFEEEDSRLPLNDNNEEVNAVNRSDTIPRIFACATMWHETKEEMIEMLKSIFRMDADQCARRVALKYFEYVDPGYYEFETHILFDDAFTLEDIPKDSKRMPQSVINPYVRTFLGTLEEAAAHVHKDFIKLRPPKLLPTPYGGRLEYTLPGKTKLNVHIKNKDKIRHKKRWSQIMYMYYLLGHRLMDQPISTARKEVIAANTFILALDGDIDFQPNAVELLVDLMKKNPNLGAACGRIHPIGSGPMVWYQKFEYAVGHWLQKATEHVFGCVLCSPGCFSLFRGKALMDDDVMAKYTTPSTEPRHYVQFDQGEDRWLCTLLLQRGYRVEYCAASDAKTHAPEGFNEFYNQRRRWVPSTMANIMDLLLNSYKVVKINPDISILYIWYQIIMMVGTILGPGTIFLMLVGAFATAFNLDQWSSFLYNFIPIVMFIIVCYFCKADFQLTVAQILSVIYALAMVAVVVAIALQVADDGPFAPSSLFLMAVAFSFIIAGIIHPLEFGCLPHGFLYYITIPSMYLLLMIYSLFNMNNVSWGTRENPKTDAEKQFEAEMKAAEKSNKKKKGMLTGFMNRQNDGKDSEGSFELSFAGLFKLMCCVTDKPKVEKVQLDEIAKTLGEVSNRLKKMEMQLAEKIEMTPMGSLNGSLTRLAYGIPGNEMIDVPVPVVHAKVNFAEDLKHSDSEEEQPEPEKDDLVNPYWIEDNDLRTAEIDFLTGKEVEFWQDLIKEYLTPLNEMDVKEKKAKEVALRELRNRAAFAFLMMNAVFVILVFLLQLEKEAIHIDWPFGGDTNVSYVPMSNEVVLSVEYLELEPIGLVFVGFFGLILITQFIGMCYHRFGTLSHILAATQVYWCSKDTNTITKEATLSKHGVGLIKRLQRTKSETELEEKTPKASKGFAGRRATIAKISQHKAERRRPDNLEQNFQKRFQSFTMSSERRNSKLFRDNKAHATFNALKDRRSTVLHRRSSVVDRRRQSMIDEASMSGRSRSDSITPSLSSRQEGRFKKNLNRQKSIMNKARQQDDIEMQQYL